MTIPLPTERESKRELLIGLACAAGVVALFSGFVLVSRLGLRTTMQPADLAALRFLGGGLVLLPLFLKHGLAGLRLHQALALALFGAFGFALLAYSGFDRAPASHGSLLIHGALPLMTMLAAYTVAGSRPGRREAFGCALIVLGVVLMLWDSLAHADMRTLTGDALLLAASLSWAIYGVLIRRLAVPAIPAAAIVAVITLILYVPAYLAVDPLRLLQFPAGELLFQGIFQGVLIGAVSLFLYTRTVTALGAGFAALISAIVPAVTTLAAVPLLGEVPSVLVLAGIAAVAAGVFIPFLAGISGRY
jgi:drug/metabolite transporter (DMT)-like permease